ncbi:O-antigen ligase family protein [Patescibacteria group bacterium]|nr:O-antigen ligase family protein [Patescibacteria group bacterium]
MIKKITQILWGIFLFTFPLSLRFVIYEQFSYRFGNFNPWVTGFLYLPEVLLGVVFTLWFINRIKTKDYELKTNFNWLWILLILFVLNAGVISFINGDPFLFAFFLLRIIEAVAIYILITDELLPIKTIVKILLSAALVQIIWGWAQWKLNHSLGLNWLGEAVVSDTTMNVAKENLGEGVKQIRPYGSFLHPNILAAYLMTILFITIPYLKKYRLLFWMIVLAGGVYFTQSSAAGFITLIGLGFVILFSFLKEIRTKQIISLLTLVILFLANAWFFHNSYAVGINNESIQERLDQNVISYSMFIDNPIGVGIGNYTLEIEKYASDKLLPWEFQPVHNVYFLIINETGIQGIVLLLIALVLIFYHYWDKGFIVPIFALVFIAPFDHFLWDSFVGVILVALVMGFFSLSNKTE